MKLNNCSLQEIITKIFENLNRFNILLYKVQYSINVYIFHFVVGGYSSYGGNYNNSSYNNSTNNGNSGPDWWGGWDK